MKNIIDQSAVLRTMYFMFILHLSIALEVAKTFWSFGRSECNRVTIFAVVHCRGIQISSFFRKLHEYVEIKHKKRGQHHFSRIPYLY